MISLIKRFFRWLKRLFRRKKSGEAEAPEAESPIAQPVPPKNTYEELARDRYAAGNFLHFGRRDGQYPEGLDLEGTAELLKIFGTDIYSVGMDAIDTGKYEPAPVPRGVHFCDFCARPLSGGEYQVLKDGRERCSTCSRTVVREPSEIKNLFREVRKRMEQFYGITFDNEVGVSVVNAKKLAKGDFKPTSDFDPRAIGYVEVKRGRQTMVLENGAPRVRFISTCAHELTHCWQNQIPFFQKLHAAVAAGNVSRDDMLRIVEGHATWSEVQYLFLIGEVETAVNFMDNYLRRNDEYGQGFRLYYEAYGFTRGPVIIKDTPFNHPENPLAGAK